MMSLATVELALQIANAAIKLGRRVDLIQTQHLLKDPLPLSLPPIPPDYTGKVSRVKNFFNSQAGQRILADDDTLKQTWEAYLSAIEQGDNDEIANSFEHLAPKWALLSGEVIFSIGDDGLMPPAEPGRLLMIEYYVVSAAKPGHQRSAIVDIALATADVALEFAGSNPAIITKDPAVQKAIASFLTYFTKGNLEDLSYRQLFERTLSSVIRAAIEHRELVEDIDALSLFLDALAKAQEADADFVAGLVSGQNFDKLLQTVVLTVGENIGKFSDNDVVIEIVGGILKDVASDNYFKKLLKGDEQAIALIAQIAIEHTANSPVLLGKVQGDELWHSVLKEVLKQVGASAKARSLFKEEALGSLVSAALRGVAQDKKLVEGEFVQRLIASVAGNLSTTPLKKLFGEGNLSIIAAAVLESAAKHTDLLIDNDKLLSAILSAVMTEGAKGFKQGFDKAFAIDLTIAAIDATAANASAINLPEQFGAIVSAVLNELSREALRSHLAKGDILKIFADAIKIVAANPHLWEQFAEGKIPASVLRSIARVVADDPTKLLSGPVLAELIIGVFDAISLRAQAYSRVVSGHNPELTTLIEQTLKRLGNEVGVKLGANNIVAVIVQLVLDWGKDKFLVDAEDPAFKTRVGEVLLAA